MSLEVRERIIALLYASLCQRDIEGHVRETLSTAAARLLKKSLPNGEPLKLSLPWRPLYDLLQPLFVPRYKDRMGIGEGRKLLALIRLVPLVRNYFTPESTKEILEETLPYINPHHLTASVGRLSILSLFLPTSSAKNEETAMDDGHADTPGLPALFKVWSLFLGVPTIDSLFLDLVARWAQDNVSEGSAAFTDEQVRWVFAVGFRALELPVGSGAGGVGGDSQASSKSDITNTFVKNPLESLARFTIYTIYPSQTTTTSGTVRKPTLDHLLTLLRATETFFHPSNHGKWTYKLCRFLQNLSLFFLERWRLEHGSNGDSKTPPANRLTADIRLSFVEAIKPLLFMALFGKDPLAVLAIQGALKNCAWLVPEAIFPGLLDRIYPSLESLTESHRTTACIGALFTTSRPLLTRSHYPPGGQNLLPLLTLLLPGIDMNDPQKASASLMFVSLMSHCVPLIDSSSMTPAAEESEDDLLCRLGTAGFEDWMRAFLGRILTLFENLPDQHGSANSGQQNSETSLMDMVTFSCEALFNQASPALHAIALKQVQRFVSENVVPNATKAVSRLCATLGGPNAQLRLSTFIPLCKLRILHELEGGAATNPSGTHASSNPFGMGRMSDAPFHYYQAIMYECILTAGPALIQYVGDIKEILSVTFEQTASRRGFLWASRLLENTLLAFLTVYPLDTRSHSETKWNDPKWQAQSSRTWGETCPMEELDIKWHIPSSMEIDVAIELLTTYAHKIMDKIRQLVTTPGPNFGYSMSRWQGWLKSILVGLAVLCEPESSVYGANSDNIYVRAVEKRPFKAGYPLSKSNRPQDYARMTQLRSEVGAVLLQSASSLVQGAGEDAVEAIKAVVKNIRLYTVFSGLGQADYEGYARILRYIKASVRAAEDHRNIPRGLLVKRVYVAHMTRVSHNTIHVMHRPEFDPLANILFQLSTSKYKEVRRSSQSALGALICSFPMYKYQFFPELLRLLASSTEEAQRGQANDDIIEGSIQMLKSSSFFGLGLHTWEYANHLLCTIVKAQKVEKPTSLVLIRKIFIEYLHQFSGISFDYQVAGNVSALAQKLIAVDIESPEALLIVAKKRQRTVVGRREYNALITNLVGILNNQELHWRFTNMALNFLQAILSNDEPLPLEVTKYVIDNMVNEHPSIRNVCISLVNQIMGILKTRSISQSHREYLDLEKCSVDEIRKSFSYESSVKVGIAFLDDASNTGWLCWPSKVKVYPIVSRAEDTYLHDPTSKDSEDYVRKTVSSPDFWRKHVNFMTQEHNNESQPFNVTTVQLYKKMLQFFGPSLIPFLEPCITECVSQVTDKSKQRCVAELLSGIVRGSKHWRETSRAEVLPFVVTTFQKGLSGATTESVMYWGECLKNMFGRHDPRRIVPVVSAILENEFNPESEAFFSQTKKVACMHAVFSLASWKLGPKIHESIEKFVTMFDNPYQQVREAIGKISAELVENEYTPSFKNVSDLLLNHDTLVPTRNDNTTQLLQRLANDVASHRSSVSSSYANVCKTVLAYFGDCLRSHRSVAALYHPLFLEEMFVMQDCSDQELQIASKRVSQVFFPQFRLPSAYLESTIRQLVGFLGGASDNGSRHLKTRILPALQILFFRNLYVLKANVQEETLSSIVTLLHDSRLEVRRLAAVTLSGLVRCSQRGVVEKLRANALNELSFTKLPKRQRGQEPSAAFQDIVVKRHGTVLTLSALVLAFPYDITAWMPDALVALSRCASDPSPIGAEVSKTFSEFRRTHQDNWHEDKLKFSEDQLYDLSDLLVSSSYYA